MNQLLVCLLVLNLGTSGLVAPNRNVFEDITLDQPLPPTFRPGELYNFKGCINNFKSNVHLVVDTKLINGDFSEMLSQDCIDSSFSFYFNFKYPGIYYLNVTLNYRNKGTEMLIVREPDSLTQQPLQPIRDFRISPTENIFTINWQTANELVQLEVIQNDQTRHYLLSNNPCEFTLNPKDFKGFSPASACFRIRGARSQTGSYYAQSSDWGEWLELDKTLVPNVEPIKKNKVEFQKPYYCIGEIDSILVLDMKIPDHFDLEAYVKRPDGWVDFVPLAKYKKRTYTVCGIIRDMGVPGNCVLEYTPRLEGTYLIEINDDEGVALINIPFYCGKALPLIPVSATLAGKDSFDLDSNRAEMLQEINRLRTRIGLRDLQLDSTLNEVAEYYSEKMIREQFYGHESPNGETAIDRKKRFKVITQIKENVARAETPKKALSGLIRSPSHYAAMIDSVAERAGFGIKMGLDSCYYVTQYFSPNPKTQEEMKKFLDDLFAAMRAEKKKLERIYTRDEWPARVGRIYTAPSMERLNRMLLVETKLETWKMKSIDKVYFESFEEKVEGFVLCVKFYTKVQSAQK